MSSISWYWLAGSDVLARSRDSASIFVPCNNDVTIKTAVWRINSIKLINSSRVCLCQLSTHYQKVGLIKSLHRVHHKKRFESHPSRRKIDVKRTINTWAIRGDSLQLMLRNWQVRSSSRTKLIATWLGDQTRLTSSHCHHNQLDIRGNRPLHRGFIILLAIRKIFVPIPDTPTREIGEQTWHSPTRVNWGRVGTIWVGRVIPCHCVSVVGKRSEKLKNVFCI